MQKISIVSRNNKKIKTWQSVNNQFVVENFALLVELTKFIAKQLSV